MNTPLYPIYIGNLPKFATEEDLFNKFSTLGILSHTQLNKFQDSSKSGNSAFVFYFTRKDAENAIYETQCSEFGGQRLRVTFYTNPGLISYECRVYVKSLNSSTTERDIYEHIRDENIHVFSVEKDSPVTAVVQFYTSEDAKLAVKKLNGTLLGRKQITFYQEGDLSVKKSRVEIPDDDAISTASQSVQSLDDVKTSGKRVIYDIYATVNKIRSNKIQFLKMKKETQMEVLGLLMWQRVSKEISKEKMALKITGMMTDLSTLSVDDVLLLLENKTEFYDTLEAAKKLVKSIGWGI